MRYANLHRWDLSPAEAEAVQRELATRVIREGSPAVRRVAGVDVAYSPETGQDHAAVVLLSFPELETLESHAASRATSFPYVPGLFAFRELPAIEDALAGLSTPPDLVLVDGHGVAHPRRLGLASHLGLLLDLPAIGCAKTRFFGQHGEPDRERGSSAPIADGAETIGRALRTRTDVAPVYVSVGHRISLDSACELVLACAPRVRLPEPLRLADQLSRRQRRASPAE